jgi:ribosomal protein S18 acetylase RimI-like enzyme
MAGEPVTILPAELPLENYLDLLQMSMGIENLAGVQRLLEVEKARGTLYFTAQVEGKTAGLIGLFVDPDGAAAELEPPQIIDLAVYPRYQRQGVARALVKFAINRTQDAGYNRLWLYTDGNSSGLLTFYRKLGFSLSAVVHDYFGDGSVKAIFRMDLGVR